jgi:hypothetical protein
VKTKPLTIETKNPVCKKTAGLVGNRNKSIVMSLFIVTL